MDPQPLLEARNLHKRFFRPIDLTVLNGVDLDVYGGESVAIMGRSGEGKSTLLQILGTLEQATRGTVKIAGKVVQRWNVARVRRQQVAYVFQSYYLLEDYNVLENVLFPAHIDRRDISKGSPHYQRALQLLDKVGLATKASTTGKLLSGGEKQRVAIARALCNDPTLLFADEPTGNLDNETAEIIISLLLEFAHTPGKALVLVTHNEALAELCKHRYLLKNGLLETETENGTEILSRTS